MNTPNPVVTHLNDISSNAPSGSPNEPAPATTQEECDCPFPWWLLALGAAVGGVGGYAAGRRSMKREDDL